MSADRSVVAIGELLWDLLPSGKQLGGAPANFAYHAGQLGARAALVSQVGADNALVRKVAGAFSLTAVAVTRGRRGALLRVFEEEVEHAGFADQSRATAGARHAPGSGSESASGSDGPEASLTPDVVGAGDAFSAALCVGLLRGDTPELIVENANRLAAYVCSQPGAMPALPHDLKQNLTT